VSRQRRYPSDLTDEQWALVEPLLPAPRTGGRLERHPRRSKDGILYTEVMLAALREQARVQQGRNPQPSAGIIDSQSVKGADTVGHDSRGYDAGKKINGRKRFIVTDTLGLLIVVVVLAASVQDRDGARTTLLSAYLESARSR
jgi:Transposase DDE domain